ncbi:hypothetical protein M0805_004074 [Coniferiporia weirii]|nr:hypothetical protein M0805_004074 [Coniferiporia weirii]
MGKTFDHIPESEIKWIRKQEAFWVATAPLSGNGHVNLSPKGLRGTFFVEGPNLVWYEDLSGSGCETVAHLRENGRITILFNALDGPPQLVRLYGKGTVHELGSSEYNARIPASKRKPGSRAIILVEVHRVGTSCGFGVPFYKFDGHRTALYRWSGQLEKNDGNFESQRHEDGAVCENGMRGWWSAENRHSIDGLPAFESVPDTRLPLSGVMPDSPEEGYRIRPTKSPKTQELNTTTTSRFSFTDGNVKLVYGLVVGFMASFVISDVFTFARGLAKV